MLEKVPLSGLSDLMPVSMEPIRVKNSNGQLVRYSEISLTMEMRQDLSEQNELLSGLDLKLRSPRWAPTPQGLLAKGERYLNPLQLSLYRVFNQSWSLGGRFFGIWPQGLPSVDRALLTMDGQAVVERDYRHLHPTLIAALAGVDLGETDPYEIAGYCRRQVKTAFLILVNAGTERSAICALQNKLVAMRHDQPGRQAKNLIDAIKARHPKFDWAWGTGLGLKLQNVDAQMCANVQRLMRRQGHTVLSIHDSFIALAATEDLLSSIMDEVLFYTTSSLARDGLPEMPS